jgi:hypothetical protein
MKPSDLDSFQAVVTTTTTTTTTTAAATLCINIQNGSWLFILIIYRRAQDKSKIFENKTNAFSYFLFNTRCQITIPHSYLVFQSAYLDSNN